MMGTVLRLGFFLLVSVPQVAACKSLNMPGDLALLSVQAVDYYDQKEISPPSLGAALLGMIPKHDLKKLGLWTDAKRPHRLLLKVEFTSHLDLSRFALDNSYNLASSAYFCRRSDEHVLMSLKAIYWHGNMLGLEPLFQDDPEEPGNPITYYSYLNVSYESTLPSNPPLHFYDLRSSPEDVCFYVSGGNNSGFGFKSNIIVIPSEAIVTALGEVPPGLGDEAD